MRLPTPTFSGSKCGLTAYSRLFFLDFAYFCSDPPPSYLKTSYLEEGNLKSDQKDGGPLQIAVACPSFWILEFSLKPHI